MLCCTGVDVAFFKFVSLRSHGGSAAAAGDKGDGSPQLQVLRRRAAYRAVPQGAASRRAPACRAGCRRAAPLTRRLRSPFRRWWAPTAAARATSSTRCCSSSASAPSRRVAAGKPNGAVARRSAPLTPPPDPHARAAAPEQGVGAHPQLQQPPGAGVCARVGALPRNRGRPGARRPPRAAPRRATRRARPANLTGLSPAGARR